jgi:signal transduction histidine kinase/CheY-like chemotaxis protein
MPVTITTVTIRFQEDLTSARKRARTMADALLFDVQDQTRIATAVSEAARYLFATSPSGEVEFLVEGATAPQVLIVRISQTPPGQGHGRMISTIDAHAAQAAAPPVSKPLLPAQLLMDQCDLVTGAGGLRTVWLKKVLPKRAPYFSATQLSQLEEQFQKERPADPMEEVRQQNEELARTLAELHDRQVELERLNRELEDTNRGVVALYAELDEKAGHLRRADEMKSSFLSEMSHEFRTPLNAILSLSQLLLDRSDGDLTAEQEKQVGYIRKSGEDLLDTVNDLLDLAKIEAGKVDVNPADCDLGTLFSALRGMLRPLLVAESVELIFEPPQDIPVLWTDERKLSQILRNFISNALKFTERGEVRVSARLTDEGRSVALAVADTGTGIAAEDLEVIFQEFTQLDNPLQRRVKGTGLGLPLCRKLAGLLGGRVEVTSALGVGSTFTVIIPVHHEAKPEVETPVLAEPVAPLPNKVPVLLVEDEPEARLVIMKYLKGSPFQPIPVATIGQAREVLRRERISAILLDILMPDASAWQWLAEIKAAPATKHIPVIVVTSVDDPQKGLALGADAYAVKPVDRTWLLEQLVQLTGRELRAPGAIPVALLIDDQESDRYVLRRLVTAAGCSVVEATDGQEGIKVAFQMMPDVIFLDWSMPQLSGRDVIEQLQAHPATSGIPIVVVTGYVPDARRWQGERPGRPVLDKGLLTVAQVDQVLHDLGVIRSNGKVGADPEPACSDLGHQSNEGSHHL